jgi:hypothetical protein
VVGFADCDEAGRGVGVVLVAVWVVLFGERVELALDFGRGCCVVYLEGFIVVG